MPTFGPRIRPFGVVVLGVLAFIYLWPGIHEFVNVYDEGVMLYGAQRVLQGQVPYRDFWTVYGPGDFYLLAAAFKLFGSSVIVERVVDTGVRSILTVAAYLLARRLTSIRLAIVAWAATTMWLGYYTYSYRFVWVNYGYPAFPAIACCFISIWLVSKSFDDTSRRAVLLSGGAWLGAAALFRHDIAAYSGVGQVLALAVCSYRRHRPTQSRAAGIDFVRRASLFAGGALAVVVPVIVGLLATVPLSDLRADLVTFPLEIYRRFRSLPYPPFTLPDNLPFYMPFAALLLAAWPIVAAIRARRDDRLAWALTMAMVAIVATFGFNQVRVRADLIHTPTFFLPCLLLLAVVIRGQRLPGTRIQVAAWITSIGSAALLVYALYNPLIDRIALFVNARRSSASTDRTLPRAAGVDVSPELRAAVQYIRDHTAPNERILVGTSRHDQLLCNEPFFYFLADRGSATKYHDMHPGIVTSAPVQEEIVGELERGLVGYAVRSNSFEGVHEPNAGGESSGVTILDDYLRRNYSAVATFGPYIIEKRR